MSGKAQFERTDVPPRGVVYALGGLFMGLAVSLGLVFGMFGAFQRADEPASATAVEAVRLIPPPPRLETSLAGDRAAIQDASRRLIEGYSWIDRKSGLARIPIERAAAITAARGWPDGQASDKAAPQP